MITDLADWFFLLALGLVLFLSIEAGLYGRALDLLDRRRRSPTLFDVLRRRPRR